MDLLDSLKYGIAGAVVTAWVAMGVFIVWDIVEWLRGRR